MENNNYGLVSSTILFTLVAVIFVCILFFLIEIAEMLGLSGFAWFGCIFFGLALMGLGVTNAPKGD